MPINLNNHIEALCRVMRLPVSQEQKQTITSCLENYGPREGCLGKIAGMAYRIWNAIKSIFGMSDWQASKDILEKRIFEKGSGENGQFNGKAGKWVANEFASLIMDSTFRAFTETSETVTDDQLFNEFVGKMGEIREIFAERLQKEQPQAV